MLLYLKLFGVNINDSLCVVVRSDSTVGQLRALIQQLRPQLECNRLLFAGRELSDVGQTLGMFNILVFCYSSCNPFLCLCAEFHLSARSCFDGHQDTTK
jgi:hypothetical protein